MIQRGHTQVNEIYVVSKRHLRYENKAVSLCSVRAVLDTKLNTAVCET